MKKPKTTKDLLKIAFTTGYSDDDYTRAFRQLFEDKKAREGAEAEGDDFIEFRDSIFYFKRENKNVTKK